MCFGFASQSWYLEGSIPIPAHLGLLEEFTEGLIRRGFDEATILKILGANFLRVMEAVCG